MSSLGEAFKRAMEKGGGPARAGQGEVAPGLSEQASRRIASAPTQEIPSYPSALPAGAGTQAATDTTPAIPDIEAGVFSSPSPFSQGASPGGASEYLAHAVRVPTFAEGPLRPGCDELAGLRASLLSRGLDRTPATIMVAGASSPGASTALAVGLAGELARDLTHQVLLLDANVSRPGAMLMLDVDPLLGMEDAIEGRAFSGEAIVHSETDNLSALVLRPDPVTGSSRATAESFLSDVARQVMAELQSAFDYVVIDAGAAERSAVPRVLASRATATVLVLERGVAQKSASAAKRAVEGGGGRVVGVVLAGRGGAAGSGSSGRGALSGAFAVPGTGTGGGRGF